MIFSNDSKKFAFSYNELCDENLIYNGMNVDSIDTNRDVANLTQFFPESKDVIACLKSLSFSGFNPVSGNRRMMGDFYYLDVIPLDSDLSPAVIVANTRGFYVSQSKDNKFNPSASFKSCNGTTLAACLSAWSPKFRENFALILKKHFNKKSHELGPLPYKVNCWLANEQPQIFDSGRNQDELVRLTEIEFLLQGQTRDWHEELQTCREMPKSTPQERAIRDHQWYSIHLDYVESSTKGAIAITNGQIPPINPQEEPRNWMYFFNNIFFTQCLDTRDVFSNAGGDETMIKNLSNDIVSLRKFNECDPDDLYTLNSVMILYKGRYFVAQTIIPGLFQGILSGEESVKYGSLDNSKISADPIFHSKIGQISKTLHLKEHKVYDNKPDATQEDIKTLWTSTDVKGIIGNDKRYYLVDFSRLQARDGNFKSDSTPIHVFRPELINAYLVKVLRAVQLKRTLEKQKNKDDEKNKSSENLQTNENESEDNESIILPDIRLNTDLFARGIKLADSEEILAQDENLNKELSHYLIDEAPTALVREWIMQGSNPPSDTETFTSVLHQRGINLRYLGVIAKLVDQYSPIYRTLLYREMIVRATKTLFNRMILKVASFSLDDFVASFLNSFFGKMSALHHASLSGINLNKENTSSITDEFGLSHNSLWASIRSVVQTKYNYTLPDMIPSSIFELPTLRALCLKIGIQIQTKVYDFAKEKIFETCNIIDFIPIIKHAAPVSSDASQLISYGKKALSEGSLELAQELLQEALSLCYQVYGPLHRETGHCFSNLALIFYQNGEIEQAFSFQEKALLIIEYAQGPDHFDTAHAYGNLAHMSSSLGMSKIALNCMRRALYLGLLTSGWNYPEQITTYINLSTLLQDNRQWEAMLLELLKALNIIDDLKDKSPKKDSVLVNDEFSSAILYASSASVYHLIAVADAALGNFREALDMERKNYAILNALQLTSDDTRMVETNMWLRELTRKAVEAEKLKKGPEPPRIGPKLTTSHNGLKKATYKYGGMKPSELSSVLNSNQSQASPSITSKRQPITPATILIENQISKTINETNSNPNSLPQTTSKKNKKNKKNNPSSSQSPVPDLI